MNTSTNHYLKLILSLMLAGVFFSACGQNDPEKPGTDEPDQNETKACDPADYCKNGGKCSVVDGKRSCDCSKTDFVGETCDEAKTCKNANPCQNGGECLVNATTKALVCDCQRDNGGVFCEEAARAFKFKVKIEEAGGYAIKTNPDYGSDYDLICDTVNKPNVAQKFKGDATCTYDKVGEYEVSIKGKFPQLLFDEDDSKLINRYITKIIDWGNGSWKSMEGMFKENDKLTDLGESTPNFSQLTSMREMFSYTSFNGSIPKTWDTSSVTDMLGMFLEARKFNKDLSGLNTSNVKNMSNMFQNAIEFNGDISNWNTSNVTYMRFMFYKAKSFNKPLQTNGNHWNISNVEKMKTMFAEAEAFNQDISGWDTSKVTDMSGVFYEAKAFNQDISKWNTTNVEYCDEFSAHTSSSWAKNKKPVFSKCTE